MEDQHTPDVIVARDVMVPMRDGVRLATDLYFPGEVADRRTGAIPAVLSRTPYNKTGGADAASFFARRGYMAAVQDCRGRYGSEGVFFPFVDDPEDGFDTIEWIADHPSCDGKVGMYGCSYDAWVQFHAATQNPPSLATMIPFEGPINAYHYSMREGGALHLGLLNWAVRMSTTSQEARANPAIAEAIRPMSGDGPQFLEWASRIPWRRGQTNVAIGAAGIAPLHNYHGQTDAQGRPLRATSLAIVDELAATAELVMGKVAQVPVAVIRGYDYPRTGEAPGAAALVREAEQDLFR